MAQYSTCPVMRLTRHVEYVAQVVDCRELHAFDVCKEIYHVLPDALRSLHWSRTAPLSHCDGDMGSFAWRRLGPT
jgi:hypothetical protein